MKDIKLILVPVDFSVGSARALEHALFLRETLGAELRLLHVVEPTRYASPMLPLGLPGGGYVPLERFTRDHFRKEMEQFLAPFGRHDWLTDVLEDGLPVDAILRAAEPCQLIVMGTHGRTGFRRWVAGSVTERVARLAPCPVLAVHAPPEGAAKRPPALGKILVASDFSPCSESAFAAARELATRFGATLEVIHVWDTPPLLRVEFDVWVESDGGPVSLDRHVEANAREALEHFLDACTGPGAARPNGRLERGRPADVVAQVATDGAFDLVVVGTHGHRGAAHLVLGSVAEKILRVTATPVLVVHGPGRAPAA